MHRRIFALALPLLPVELVHIETDGQTVCVAVLDAARHPQLTCLNRAASTLRIDAVNPQAWREGIRPGQTLASATARLASLELRLLRAGAIEAALQRISEAFLGLSPVVAPCMHPHGALVLLDAQGLLKHNSCEYEAFLASSMLGIASALGHHGRVAVADGPWAAAALARFGKVAGFFGNSQVFRAPSGPCRPLLSRLPLAAADLPAEHQHWLSALGIHVLGDLERAPRKELTVRLGAAAKHVLQRLDGPDADPLTPFVVSESPVESQLFDDDCTHTEPILFALRGLSARIAARLFGRGMASRRLLVTFLAAGGLQTLLAVELPSPIHRAADIFAVLKARMDSFRLNAPVRTLLLAAELLAPRDDHSGHLFQALDRGELALPRVLGELVAHHGDDSVGFLQVNEAWRPDDRSTLLPSAHRPTPVTHTNHPHSQWRARLPESHPLLQPIEPLRVFSQAVSIDPLELVAPYLHLEGAEWWRYGDEALVLHAARGGEGTMALVDCTKDEHLADDAAMGEGRGGEPGAGKGASLMRLWGWFG